LHRRAVFHGLCHRHEQLPRQTQDRARKDHHSPALELGFVTEQPTLPPLAAPTESHREVSVAVRLRGDQITVLQWLSTLQSPEKFQAIKLLDLEIDTKARMPTPQVICNLTLARWFKPDNGI
jgi:hypothetical protein